MFPVLILALALTGPPEPANAQAQMACSVGPVAKHYGASEWEVYSCSDARSIVVVANEGSRAFPFYFMLTPEGERVKLHGEGTGDQEATRAAFKDLDRLSPTEVAAILAETLAVARSN